MKHPPSTLGGDEASTFFSELIDTLTERGRALLGRRGGRAAIPQVDLTALGELLLSRRGEASGVALAARQPGRCMKRPGVRLRPAHVNGNGPDLDSSARAPQHSCRQ